jgi:hypothetical protein
MAVAQGGQVRLLLLLLVAPTTWYLVLLVDKTIPYSIYPVFVLRIIRIIIQPINMLLLLLPDNCIK